MSAAIDSQDDPRICGWRKDAWLKLGYSANWADFLSHSQIDTHVAEKMLAQGADPRQVLRILAGTCALGEDTNFDWDGFYRRMLSEVADVA